jgi:hypothetical protein
MLLAPRPRNALTRFADSLRNLDYVIRRLDALSTGVKGWLKGLTFAETPLNAISTFNGSLEASEVRRLLIATHPDGSSFRADLELLTPK